MSKSLFPSNNRTIAIKEKWAINLRVGGTSEGLEGREMGGTEGRKGRGEGMQLHLNRKTVFKKINKSKCHRKKLEINYGRKITENLTSVDRYQLPIRQWCDLSRWVSTTN